MYSIIIYLRNIYKEGFIIKIMKRGKEVVLGMVMIGIILGLILSVNAGWWSTITGKATNTRVNVTVNAPTTAANITFVVKPNDPSLNSNCWGQINKTIYFTAYHYGGISLLPDNLDQPLVNSWIRANFTNGGVTRYANYCAYINDITAYSKNYSCNVSMANYDDPTPWTITVSIRTTAGAWSLVNNSQTFTPNTYNNPVFSPNHLNWTQYPVVLGTTNNLADYAINITNCGNIDIGVAPYMVKVNASNLSGETINTEIIPAINFASRGAVSPTDFIGRTDAATICGASALLDSLWSYPILNIPHTSVLSRPLKFCIVTLPGTISSQTYSAKNTWNLDVGA